MSRLVTKRLTTLKLQKNFWIIILVNLSLSNLLLNYGAVIVQNACGSSVRNTYTVTVCIIAPIDNVPLSGVVSVDTTVSVTENSPGVQKLIFHLDDEYLITDYAVPYAFELPSDHFVDGTRRLSVQVVMRDDFLTDSLASITLNFDNGVTSPPINTRQFTPYIPQTTPGMPLIVAATGDGASGETPEVTDLIASWDPDMFLYLGDVYENGTYTEFYNWYGTSGAYFSEFRSITNPSIGNHESESGVAPGYYDYWDNVPDYYSFDTGGWHFISLNSTLPFNPRRSGGAQLLWLEHDIKASKGACILAYWHHPRFSIGDQGDTPAMDDTWQLLATTSADVILTGHDHNYQRWAALDGSGRPSEDGIVQFVVGTGGHGISDFVRADERMIVGFDTSPEAFGALRLEMYPDWLQFEYVNIEGNVLDSGEIECYGDPL